MSEPGGLSRRTALKLVGGAVGAAAFAKAVSPLAALAGEVGLDELLQGVLGITGVQQVMIGSQCSLDPSGRRVGLGKEPAGLVPIVTVAGADGCRAQADQFAGAAQRPIARVVAGREVGSNALRCRFQVVQVLLL